MRAEKIVEKIVHVIDLDDGPKLFVVNLPADTPHQSRMVLGQALGSMGLETTGSHVVILFGDATIQALSDDALHQVGLMRILTAERAQATRSARAARPTQA